MDSQSYTSTTINNTRFADTLFNQTEQTEKKQKRNNTFNLHGIGISSPNKSIKNIDTPPFAPSNNEKNGVDSHIIEELIERESSGKNLSSNEIRVLKFAKELKTIKKELKTFLSDHRGIDSQYTGLRKNHSAASSSPFPTSSPTPSPSSGHSTVRTTPVPVDQTAIEDTENIGGTENLKVRGHHDPSTPTEITSTFQLTSTSIPATVMRSSATPATEKTATSNSVIYPTTPLPSLKALAEDSVTSTLIENLKNDLVQYQQQHSIADVSALLSTLNDVANAYEIVSLITGISAFSRSIKAAHPDVAKIYDEKLQKITDEIKKSISTDEQSTRRTKRSPFEHIMLEGILKQLYDFEYEPMNSEMRTFFKGFNTERALFSELMADPYFPKPKEIQYLFDHMTKAAEVIRGLSEYASQIKTLLDHKQYEEVGKIAFRTNILYQSGKSFAKKGQLADQDVVMDPYGELLAKFQQFTLTHIKALSEITEDTPTSHIPLNEIIAYTYAYDSLRMARIADGIGEGFCLGDSLTQGIAAEYGKLTQSLQAMAEAVLYGSGYTQYPLNVKRVLQELPNAYTFSSLNNELLAFGIKTHCIYYHEIIRELRGIIDSLRSDIINNGHYGSLTELVNVMFRRSMHNAGLVQFLVKPCKTHIIYMELRKISNQYKLLIQDIQTGLHIITGSNLDELNTEMHSRLESFRKKYHIPHHKPGSYLRNRGFTQLSHSKIAGLEDMQLFPESALTVKDIMTNPPASLQAIDVENTKALIEKYLTEVSKKSNQKFLQSDPKAKPQSQGASASVSDEDFITIKDPIIAQMREVLAALKYGAQIPENVKELHSHIIKTLDSIDKQLENPDPQAASSSDHNVPTLDQSVLSANELIALGIEHDFIRLINPGSAGLTAITQQPGASAPDHDPAQDTGETQNSSIGGRVAGGFSSFAAAVGGALTAFRLSCPGCLTQMVNQLLRREAEETVEQLIEREAAERVAKKAAEKAAEKAAKKAAEKAAKKAAEKAAKKAAEEAAEKAAKKAAKKTAEETLEKLLRCRRSTGLCNLSKDAAELEKLAEIAAELESAEEAGDAITIAILKKKMQDLINDISSNSEHKKKSNKENRNKEKKPTVPHSFIAPPPPKTAKSIIAIQPTPESNKNKEIEYSNSTMSSKLAMTTSDISSTQRSSTHISTDSHTTTSSTTQSAASTTKETIISGATTSASTTGKTTTGQQSSARLSTGSDTTVSPTTQTTTSTTKETTSSGTRTSASAAGESTIGQQSTHSNTTVSPTTATIEGKPKTGSTTPASTTGETTIGQQSTHSNITTAPTTATIEDTTRAGAITSASAAGESTIGQQSFIHSNTTTSPITATTEDAARAGATTSASAAATGESTIGKQSFIHSNTTTTPTTATIAGKPKTGSPTPASTTGETAIGQQSTHSNTTVSPTTATIEDTTRARATTSASAAATGESTIGQQSVIHSNTTTALTTATIEDTTKTGSTAPASTTSETAIEQQSIRSNTTTSPITATTEDTTRAGATTSASAAATGESTIGQQSFTLSNTTASSITATIEGATRTGSTTPASTMGETTIGQQSTHSNTTVSPTTATIEGTTRTGSTTPASTTGETTIGQQSTHSNTTVSPITATIEDTTRTGSTTPASTTGETTIGQQSTHSNTTVSPITATIKGTSKTGSTTPANTTGETVIGQQSTRSNTTVSPTTGTIEDTTRAGTTTLASAAATNATTPEQQSVIHSNTTTAPTTETIEDTTGAHTTPTNTTDETSLGATIASNTTGKITTGQLSSISRSSTDSDTTLAQPTQSTTLANKESAASEAPTATNTTSKPTPQDDAQNSSTFPRMVKAFSARNDQIKDQFNNTISKTSEQALAHIQQLTTANKEQKSIQTRVILGETLNTLNDVFDKGFLSTYKHAHRTLKSLRSVPVDNDHKRPAARTIITDTVTSTFQQMYTILSQQRLQLFIDVGYVDPSKLSRDEMLKLRAATSSQEGEETLKPVNLLKVIADIQRGASSDTPNQFDRFLADLSMFLQGTSKVDELEQQERESGTTSPILQQRKDLWSSIAKLGSKMASGDVVASQSPPHNQQLLASVMKQEKELFIDDVQALHLRDEGHFKDEVSLSEAQGSVLFDPRTFLDVIKEPQDYRIVLEAYDSAPVQNRTESEPAETTTHHGRKRRNIETGATRPQASSATRQTGILNDIKKGLGRLFGSMGPMMSPQSVMAPPALAEIADQETFHNSNHRPNQAPGKAHSSQYTANSSLLLATLFASKYNGRKLLSDKDTMPPTGQQELLSRSPGMQLLNDGLAITPQLHSEVTAFIQHLKSPASPVTSQWNRNDLVNMAILLSTPATPGKIPAKLTETFLQQALTSSAIGVHQEQSDGIFSAAELIQGTANAREEAQPIFHNPPTGQTTTKESPMGLAQVMLQAMAINRLASYSANHNLPDSLHKQIIRQAVQLQNRQQQNNATQSGALSDNGNNNDAVPDMIEMLDQRLMPAPVLQPEKSLHNPLINALTMGQYEASRKLFMQQSLQHQLAMVDELAELPDYLGVDYSAEPLAQLKSDLQKATSSQTAGNDEITDLQSFALSQRAWQLFNNLYDAKIAVPKEAMNRVKIQAMINRRGLIEPRETGLLQELVVDLLPRQASASDHAKLTLKTDQTMPSPATLHHYSPERIASIISSYETLKSFVAEQFPQVFDNISVDPELKNELISHVALISLDALKGKVADNRWQQTAMETLKQEYKEFKEQDGEVTAQASPAKTAMSHLQPGKTTGKTSKSRFFASNKAIP